MDSQRINAMAEERLVELRKRGRALSDKINERYVFGTSFLKKIELSPDATSTQMQCYFLHLRMGIDYAEELMMGFEKEVSYLLKFGLDSNMPLTSSREYVRVRSFVCPDDKIKRMYEKLFLRLKPVFEQFGVEFDVQGSRIVVPYTLRMNAELMQFSKALSLEFGGYILEMQPCIICLGKALNLFDLLQKNQLVIATKV